MEPKLSIDRLIPWFGPMFVFLWGTSFIVPKYSMPYVEPITFNFMRFCLVVLCMLPVVTIFKAHWPNKNQVMHIAIAGIFLQAAYICATWIAINDGMSSGLAALILGLQPILTAWFAAFVSERLSFKQWLGLTMGFVGVGLVVWTKLSIDAVNYLSLFAILCGLASITFGALYQKKFCPKFDLRSGAVIQFGVSAIACIPAMFLLETRQVILSPEFLFSLLWSVFALSIGAISLLYILISKSDATKVTSLMYLTPPTAAIMAWLLFDEPISLVMALGMLITIYAVTLVNKSQRNRN